MMLFIVVSSGALAGGHFQAEEAKLQMAIPFLLLIMILLLILPWSTGSRA
jgi:hypothetical protein